MMKLIIAEKPSMGKLIAEAMGDAVKKDRMSVELKSGEVITWAAGHLMELYNPDEYDTSLREWSLKRLPIIPNTWKSRVKSESKDLYENIKRLAQKATHIIHAGDADREGQLIVDSILDSINYMGKVTRLWITNPTIEGIQEAYKAMQSNEKYSGFSNAAIGRQRSDWLIGINFTRAYTCRLGGKTISMGRVQTPTLAFIVDRDRAIENFVEVPFYEIVASCVVSEGAFQAKWIPSEIRTELDPEGRILDKKIASKFVETMTGAVGHISKAERKEVKTAPPLPYAISDLQMDCSKKYDFSPAETLSIVQKLYESRLVTYPRSDCPYLPEGLFSESPKTIAMIKEFFPDLSPYADIADLSRKSKAWDDTKLEEHHGLIPTGAKPGHLTEEQLKVFDLLCRRYLAQFLPEQRHDSGEIEMSVKNETLRSTEKREIDAGWQVLYRKETGDSGGKNEQLPVITKGEQVALRELVIEDKKTSPPKAFSEASLLEAMKNAHKYVQDPEIKKVLKAEKGIGTGATQANIIETLFKRGYVVKKGKNIQSTLLGRAVVDVAPKILRVPDMSALWEQNLREINHGSGSVNVFVATVGAATSEMIAELKNQEYAPSVLDLFKSDRGNGAKNEGGVPCIFCTGKMVQRISAKGKFWVCTSADCGMIVNDERGKPQKIGKCPVCGGNAVRVNGRNGVFWACRNQECKKTFAEDAIKPLKSKKAS